MSVLLMGHLGNMGRRYAAVLDYLEQHWQGYDVREIRTCPPLTNFTHVIVATPTDTHVKILADLLNQPHKLSILCEKPIARGAIPAIENPYGHTVAMVNNYNYIDLPPREGVTFYDYYNSGSDGLHWDCIQLVHLARGHISLNNKSPVWACTINGARIDRAAIDQSYVDMIADFCGPQLRLWGIDDIIEAHRKAAALVATC